jgi:hypothetical protein
MFVWYLWSQATKDHNHGHTVSLAVTMIFLPWEKPCAQGDAFDSLLSPCLVVVRLARMLAPGRTQSGEQLQTSLRRGRLLLPLDERSAGTNHIPGMYELE